MFERSICVGRRFPICKIPRGKLEIEVSTLSSGLKRDQSIPFAVKDGLSLSKVRTY